MSRLGVANVLSGREGISNPAQSRYRGIAAPFIPQPKGYFEAKGTRDVLWSAILNILLTPKGTRIMIPEFGSELRDLLFEPNDDLLAGALRMAIFDALERWEPRIRLINAVVYTDIRNEHHVHVDMQYEIINESAQDTRSLLVSRNGQLVSQRVLY